MPTSDARHPAHPNHNRHYLHHAGPAPRAPTAPRTTFTERKAKADPVHNPPPDSVDAQPTEWTLETLTAKVLQVRQKEREKLIKVAEKQFEDAGMPRENWDAAKMSLGLIGDDDDTEGSSKIVITELLRGLWRVPMGVVIEGECPVSSPKSPLEAIGDVLGV